MILIFINDADWNMHWVITPNEAQINMHIGTYAPLLQENNSDITIAIDVLQTVVLCCFFLNPLT